MIEAIRKNYIETSYRNGINIYETLLRLTLDEPLTISEIMSEKK